MKVLIYLNKNELNDSGGPLGYCNTLYKEIIEHNNSEIFFLDQPVIKKSRIYKFFGKIAFLRMIKRFFFFKKLLNNKEKHYSPIDLNQFDVVHFHLTQDLYSIRDSLKNYKGKIVLTSHSPVPASLEATVDLGHIEKFLFKKLYSKLINMDIYSFERANIWLFPCQESEEAYRDLLPQFEKYKKNKSVFYLPTGIYQKQANLTRDIVRQKYKIPADAFVVSYVGRHNIIKGYDRLKMIGKTALEKIKNLYIVVAGKEKPLKRLKEKRWIEIGWTNDPQSVIAASDVFLLPNKYTYFDLVLLEALSLGKVVLLSNTGGNKYFAKQNSSGIFVFEDENEAFSILSNLSKLKKSELDKMGEDNISLYRHSFTESLFYENYLKFYNCIYGI